MTSLTVTSAIAGVSGYRVPRHPAPIDLDLTGTELPPLDPDTLAAALAAAAPEGWRYPSTSDAEASLATEFGIDAARVILGAGSDDLLERAFRCMITPGSEVILTDPTFEMLPRYAALNGATVRSVAWPDGDLPLAALAEAVTPRTGLLAIVTPNNPTGTTASTASLRELARRNPGVLLVVDGAYAEFAADDPLPELLDEPNVLITRTASKAWGMPGLRVGFGFGPEAIVAAMRRAGTPYPISTPSLAATLSVRASSAAAMRTRVDDVRATRRRLVACAEELGLNPTRSEANFICTATPRAAWLRDGLAGLGIGVRWLPGLPDRVRITCPLRDSDTRRLVAALGSVISPEALLLDMDGVIADVSTSYRTAIIETAAQFGVLVSPEQISTRKALGDANDDWALTCELIRAGGREASLAAVTDAFETRYQGTVEAPGLRRSESLIGGRDLFARLAERLPLAIVTGRPQADADRFLIEHDLADLFPVVIAREAGPLKPDPFPVQEALRRLGISRAWMVGDTPDDLRAACTAGVVPIGIVAPGDTAGRTAPALSRAGAARVFTTLEDLLACLP
ncbi:MAG TPA: aminotransferase class I/II-fold pyridoxal phosphate-dependent enzyme [Gemmatimonadales bacterium]|nr:aminotransferase class I/II-fold pyridoxal phosphate-dependent enzyme [Gemmatimonadales bacterium]